MVAGVGKKGIDDFFRNQLGPAIDAVLEAVGAGEIAAIGWYQHQLDLAVGYFSIEFRIGPFD